MIELSTEQLLYLLYAVAYSKQNKVTKSDVKQHLSKGYQKDAPAICDALCQKQLLESPKKGQLFVTDQGKKVLAANLQSSKYEFESAKGAKLINTLWRYCQIGVADSQTSDGGKEMDFETFVEKFKALYFEERKRQELRGVVAIRSREICQKFLEQNDVSLSNLNKNFALLKSTGKVFAVIEQEDELIQWVE
ncbi:hypothetical protein K4039_08190 [Lyngbya sp. CCAP 1446/10]|uniref:hypothetical protein n=1 Tax=Lyngbya sp. CCAP 1446/10 TaxID=439293 RepID=UPI0022380B2D|nr:hypothetical protein [Lyngbya sp. CCAP 1446/10]MCW6050062.1 hypothetical protein [Lyngbya sp. CCAP 1446/10]